MVKEYTRTYPLCGRIGCNKKATAWIDFGFPNQEYSKLWFCKADWKILMDKIEEEIQEERRTGKLGKSEGYPIVPHHITKKVLSIK